MIKNGRQHGTNLSDIRDDHRNRYLFACQAAKLLGIDTVADIGSGIGYGSYMLALAGCDVESYEIDQDAIDFGNIHFNHARITRHKADIANIHTTDCQMITAFEIMEHTDRFPSFLERARADLLICSVPNELVIPFRDNKHKEHYRHYTPAEFVKQLNDCGWTDVTLFSQKGKYGADANIAEWNTDNELGRTLIAYAHRSV